MLLLCCVVWQLGEPSFIVTWLWQWCAGVVVILFDFFDWLWIFAAQGFPFGVFVLCFEGWLIIRMLYMWFFVLVGFALLSGFSWFGVGCWPFTRLFGVCLCGYWFVVFACVWCRWGVMLKLFWGCYWLVGLWVLLFWIDGCERRIVAALVLVGLMWLNILW